MKKRTKKKENKPKIIMKWVPMTEEQLDEAIKKLAFYFGRDPEKDTKRTSDFYKTMALYFFQKC